MKRHLWAGWQRVERCTRPGCKALRDVNRHRRRYTTDGGKTWGSARPACTGRPTTDEEAK